MRLARIAGFRLVTQAAERLARFYAALGFAMDDERVIDPTELALLGIAGGGRRRPLRLGQARVDLDCYETAGRSYPADANAASACFQHLALVADDAAAAWAKVREAGATPLSRGGPVTLPPETGSVTAIKFRDPDGHPLELIHFPDGPTRGWTGTGVLGIDHSALVVTDLAASRTFYAALGLGSGEATLNRGSTQDALDGLNGACADVVPMIPGQAPPHVELLHYRSPPGAPWSPWSPNDVAATRIVWAGDAAALLRDPDGHLHQVDG